ncbi:type VI secretion system protein TssA [Psychromonas sp. Urea-02u-13]|uniref:type VI secretion system protein TssA n=1 Tax=Psychromonas sp. Urea-02u-13 TaxID=2058326 RepID=UPI000C32C8D1|nr:type VI secretion system protein TssA [Psychromonas sp. Urea-02u-13]PKG38771.1 type VI secretion system protein TssA [Psychromonas sp. Urea-02u-13]
MPSPSLIDISALISPIEGELSVGNDLRDDPSYTSDYSQIKDARRAARDAERNNMFDGDNSEALEHWQKIFQLAPKVIATQSKDLEIACWLTEALVRKSGFQGLKDGFTLIRQLVENFWEQGLYPIEDEDGVETRVAPIAGLNGEGADGVLLSPIRNSGITEDMSYEPFSLWQYSQAVDVSRIEDDRKRNSLIDKNGFSMEDIEKAVNQSSSEYYIALFDDIETCLTQYRAVNTLLTDFCGSYDAPSTSKIIELVEEAKSALNHIAKNKLPVMVEVTPIEEEQLTNGNAEKINSVAPVNTIQAALNSRDDAFKQLNTIAEYFLKTEPHSPISYILSKAIKWGNMPLEQLMQELIPDSSSRETYSSLTGVKVDE